MSHAHGSSSAGSMAMALHLGLNDLVLFEAFVPSNWGQYVGALCFTFALAVLAAGLSAAKKRLVKRRISHVLKLRETRDPAAAKPALIQAATATTATAPLGSHTDTLADSNMNSQRSSSQLLTRTRTSATRDPSYLIHQMTKFALDLGHIFIGYLVMLIVMQFNIGYLLAASVGYGFAAWLFEDASSEKLM
ncbi:Ctr copper transporter [Obelidium mucronatum]|nr:Ctr copper transporter [Obelidium mucronatum]